MLDLNFSEDSRIVTHPRFNSYHEAITQGLSSFNLTDHLIILSSGTTSTAIKGYALSRNALLTNAKAVNEHFQLTPEDVWALSLPHYHVGGLSVLCRAYLLGNRVVSFEKWEVTEWKKLLDAESVTITTVVPTQVYDLVKANISAPRRLRYLIVGGDFLSEELERKALALGWPVIRTFGMTEVCSQLASGKKPGEKELSVLRIHQVQNESTGRLLVKSESLFTLQFKLQEKLEVSLAKDFCNAAGFYATQDRVILTDHGLFHQGRLDEQVKISGRLVDLNQLRELLAVYTLAHDLYGKVEVDLIADERKGLQLRLLFLKDVSSTDVLKIQELFSPLKIDQLTQVSHFSRTDLGKLKKFP